MKLQFTAILCLIIAASGWYYWQQHSQEQRLQSAEALLQQSEYRAARQICEDAPDSSAKTRCLRISRLMLEKHKVEQFHAEAENEADKAYALTVMGETEAVQGNYARAAIHFNQAIQLNPAIAQAYFGIGQILHKQGRIRESLAWYDDAVERAPNNLRFLHALAANFAERKQLDLAEEKYRMLLKLDNSQLLVYAELAELLKKQGKATEAQELVQQARQGLADNPGWKDQSLNAQAWSVMQQNKVVSLESWEDKLRYLDSAFGVD